MDESKIFCQMEIHPITQNIRCMDEKAEKMRWDFKIYLLVQKKQHE